MGQESSLVKDQRSNHCATRPTNVHIVYITKNEHQMKKQILYLRNEKNGKSKTEKE